MSVNVFALCSYDMQHTFFISTDKQLFTIIQILCILSHKSIIMKMTSTTIYIPKFTECFYTFAESLLE